MSIIKSNSIGGWLIGAAVAALLLIPLAVAGFRLNLYFFPVASKVLGLSLLLALATFLISVVVSLKQRNSTPKISKLASIASIVSLIPLLFLGSQIITAKSLPMIHNISTDVVNPPAFDKITSLRGANSNPHVYDSESLAKEQQEAYPKIKTLLVTQTKQQAYEQSLKTVRSLGWDIVSKDPVKRIIEASQTSVLWGFTDDVVVRVTGEDGQAKIDLRSVSRVGRSDLGKNAERISTFLDYYGQ